MLVPVSSPNLLEYSASCAAEPSGNSRRVPGYAERAFSRPFVREKPLLSRLEVFVARSGVSAICLLGAFPEGVPGNFLRGAWKKGW